MQINMGVPNSARKPAFLNAFTPFTCAAVCKELATMSSTRAPPMTKDAKNPVRKPVHAQQAIVTGNKESTEHKSASKKNEYAILDK